MREKFGFLVCVWILLWSNCLAGFVVTKNSFRLTSPESIKGVYECAIRNTGVPQYGGTMVGAVFYPGANQRACRNFDGFHISFKSRPGAFSTVLLVDRGDCYYSLKAWYDQKAGAAAVLIADDISEPLICADTPEEDNHPSAAAYLRNITIPSALIDKSLGDSIKKALRSREMVNIILDWGLDQSHLPIVKYEFWMNSNYECGPKGDSQIEFVKNFRRAAKTLEQQGYTHFTPHFVTWYCPQAFVLSRQCKSQCINHGRYCAPDPDQDFSNGYEGKDVVVQNLRQACFFKVANESGKPWLWWDYVTSFAIRCPMKEKKYTKECADKVIRSLGRWSRGIDLAKIDKCIGDTGADMKNPVLEAELDAQNGYHGDMLTLPTLVINNRQYRGKLEKGAVLKAMCANFPDNKEPATCFREVIETHVPLQNNDGAGWTES